MFDFNCNGGEGPQDRRNNLSGGYTFDLVANPKNLPVCELFEFLSRGGDPTFYSNSSHPDVRDLVNILRVRKASIILDHSDRSQLRYHVLATRKPGDENCDTDLLRKMTDPLRYALGHNHALNRVTLQANSSVSPNVTVYERGRLVNNSPMFSIFNYS